MSLTRPVASMYGVLVPSQRLRSTVCVSLAGIAHHRAPCARLKSGLSRGYFDPGITSHLCFYLHYAGYQTGTEKINASKYKGN